MYRRNPMSLLLRLAHDQPQPSRLARISHQADPTIGIMSIYSTSCRANNCVLRFLKSLTDRYYQCIFSRSPSFFQVEADCGRCGGRRPTQCPSHRQPFQRQVRTSGRLSTEQSRSRIHSVYPVFRGRIDSKKNMATT